jgi:hypothetical protein
MKYHLLLTNIFLSFFAMICVAQEDTVGLQKEDLQLINDLVIGDSSYYIDENECIALTAFLELNFIDSLTYLTKKKKEVTFIIRDTNVIHKINGELNLPCKDKNATFKDNPVEEESISIHTYVGQLKALNKYIVQTMGWEDYEFKFIDKTTGDTSHYFAGLPYLSPSKKNMLELTANVYSMTTELSLYNVKKNKIKSVFFASFCKWMLAEEGFWAKDGNFYLAVNKTSEFWTTAGDVRKPTYYLKIKLKQ